MTKRVVFWVCIGVVCLLFVCVGVWLLGGSAAKPVPPLGLGSTGSTPDDATASAPPAHTTRATTPPETHAPVFVAVYPLAIPRIFDIVTSVKAPKDEAAVRAKAAVIAYANGNEILTYPADISMTVRQWQFPHTAGASNGAPFGCAPLKAYPLFHTAEDLRTFLAIQGGLSASDVFAAAVPAGIGDFPLAAPGQITVADILCYYDDAFFETRSLLYYQAYGVDGWTADPQLYPLQDKGGNPYQDAGGTLYHLLFCAEPKSPLQLQEMIQTDVVVKYAQLVLCEIDKADISGMCLLPQDQW